jgi:hypothetical protein
VILAVLGSIAALTYLVPYERTHKRGAELREIFSDLKTLEADPKYREAVRLNTEFFKAIRNPFSYVWWLIFRAPRMRKNRTEIVEIIDLPFTKWQKRVLDILSWFEVWMGALKPIKNRIIRELDIIKAAKPEPIVIASIGCGGMELERQIVFQLVRERFNFPLVFIGVDYSTAGFEVAASKLEKLTGKGLVKLVNISHLDIDALNRLKAEAAPQTFTIVYLNADAFELKDLPEDSFDLVYHTRLRHHLTLKESRRLDELALHLAPKLIELDDLFSVPGILTTSIFVWRFPAILNGAIFSFLKDFSQKELLASQESGWQANCHGGPFSSYLRVYNKRLQIKVAK